MVENACSDDIDAAFIATPASETESAGSTLGFPSSGDHLPRQNLSRRRQP